MVRYIISPGNSDETVLDEGDINSHNPVKTHSGKADNRVTVSVSESVRTDLEEHAQTEDRVNLELSGNVEWTGYLIGVSLNQSTATTSLKLDGIEKRLEETRPDYDSLGGSLTYSNISLADAIDDYWGRTPFDNHSVTPQSTESVATDEEVQSADTTTEWGNITSIGDTEPLEARNGNLELLQTCFTSEAEDYDTGTNTTTQFIDTASNGEAENIDTASGVLEFDFIPEYTIPAAEVTVFMRSRSGTNSGNNFIDVLIDGETVANDVPTAGFDTFEWATYDDSGNAFDVTSDLTGGETHTLRVEADGSSGDDDIQIDVVAPADGRYSYTLDNDNGGNDGYLDGPELYPATYQTTLNSINTSFNISAANLDSTWTDTSNNQQVAVTLDGATYLTADNSSTLDQSFTSQVGRSITTRFTFSRYGSRTTATPQTGFNGQNVQDYTLKVDGNNLVVIDELSLSRNHFDNLKTLHDYGNFLWVISHDAGTIPNMTVTSFQEGDETKPTPSGFDDPENKTSEVNATNYYNSIYLQGAEDENGNRPTAIAKDQDAINNDGREISPGVLRDPDVTTEAGATFRARSLLETALSNSDRVGSVSVPYTPLNDPGFARDVSFGSGSAEKTVEEVSLSESSGDIGVTYRFSLPDELAEDIDELKRKSRNIGDQV